MVIIHSNFNMIIARGSFFVVRQAQQKRDLRLKSIATHFNEETYMFVSTPKNINSEVELDNYDLIFSEELSNNKDASFVFSKKTQTEARIFALLGYKSFIFEAGEVTEVKAKGHGLLLTAQIAMVLNQSLNGHFKDIEDVEVMKKVSKVESEKALVFLAQFVKKIKVYAKPVKPTKEKVEKIIE